MTGLAFAQTESENLQKYWKLRNDLREQFTKIGPDIGESLPARVLSPLDCVDDDFGITDGTDSFSSQTPMGRYGHGTMHFGDGMIRHGYYLGVLATEYRLLKNQGQDVSGVVNELYFALKAINRLDLSAESTIDENYNIELQDNLNGFYLREDIPEKFSTLNWPNSNFEFRCEDSPMYYAGTAMHADEVKNSYQNVPSLDQFSSLLLGFSLIHKLVDDEFAQPEGETGFYLVTETKAILDRMMNYLNNHNWMMIDVNGWPVANQGGDCSWAAYPLYLTAKRITGHDYLNDYYRRAIAYSMDNIQCCLTGFGREGNSPDDINYACDQINTSNEMDTEYELLNAVPASINNCQDNSRYQDWLISNIGTLNQFIPGINGSVLDDAKKIWEELLIALSDSQNLLNDINDDGKISSAPFPINKIRFHNPSNPDLTLTDRPYSLMIVGNIAVASGTWNAFNCNTFSEAFNNYQLNLLNAVLNGQSASHYPQFYKNYLDGMNIIGPFNMKSTAIQGVDNNGTEGYFKGRFGLEGWRTDNRWTNYPDAVSGEEYNGIFNGLDYLLFHNLYRLHFGSSIPYENNLDCYCSSFTTITTDDLNIDDYTPEDIRIYFNQSPVLTIEPGNLIPASIKQNIVADLNLRLSFANKKAVNALDPVSNHVSSSFDISPQFPMYVDWKIFPNKFITENAVISTTGILNVTTQTKLCNNKLLSIDENGQLIIHQSTFTVGSGSVIYSKGIVRVKAGTVLKIGGALEIAASGSLIIEDGGRVDILEGAVLKYSDGATIEMQGPSSALWLAGALKIMNPTEFKITHSGWQCGQLVICSATAELQSNNFNSSWNFEGSGKGKTFITFLDNAKLHEINNAATSITFDMADIQMGLNSELRLEDPAVFHYSNFSSTSFNYGIKLAEGASIYRTDFLNTPIDMDFTLQMSGEFKSIHSTFTQSFYHPSIQSLLKITKRGYLISNCTFSTKSPYAIYSTGLNLASSISSSQISYNGTTSATDFPIGLFDNSNVEIVITNSLFENLYKGIVKHLHTLTLRCNTFQDNSMNNLELWSNSKLNMNSVNAGGYNRLFKTTSNRNVLFIGSSFPDISNGFNFIENVPNYTFYGSIFTYCNPCATIDISGNQWNNSNSLPSNLGTVNTYNSGQAPLSYTNNYVSLNQTCPIGATDPGVPESNTAKSVTIDLPIYSSIENDTIGLFAAYHKALSFMSCYNDTLYNDFEAFYRLAEIESLNDSLGPQIGELRGDVVEKMKAAIEGCHRFNLVSLGTNFTYDPSTQIYINALMKVSSDSIRPDNYNHLFKLELHKAHILNLTNHKAEALTILNQLELCGLDSIGQQAVNEMKVNYLNELLVQAAAVQEWDTLYVVDTSGFIAPSTAINSYQFGADISDINNLIFTNCGFFLQKDKRMANSDDFLIFPNPTNDDFIQVIITNSLKGLGQMQLSQIDGRTIQTKALFFDGNYQTTIDLSGIESGSYTLIYILPNGRVLSNSFVKL
jgi:hypothetical protein